jgi:hypothetical protein
MRKGSGGSNRLVRYFLIKLPVFSLAYTYSYTLAVETLPNPRMGARSPKGKRALFYGMFSGTHRYVAIEIERMDRWIAKA